MFEPKSLRVKTIYTLPALRAETVLRSLFDRNGLSLLHAAVGVDDAIRALKETGLANEEKFARDANADGFREALMRQRQVLSEIVFGGAGLSEEEAARLVVDIGDGGAPVAAHTLEFVYRQGVYMAAMQGSEARRIVRQPAEHLRDLRSPVMAALVAGDEQTLEIVRALPAQASALLEITLFAMEEAGLIEGSAERAIGEMAHLLDGIASEADPLQEDDIDRLRRVFGGHVLQMMAAVETLELAKDAKEATGATEVGVWIAQALFGALGVEFKPGDIDALWRVHEWAVAHLADTVIGMMLGALPIFRVPPTVSKAMRYRWLIALQNHLRALQGVLMDGAMALSAAGDDTSEIVSIVTSFGPDFGEFVGEVLPARFGLV